MKRTLVNCILVLCAVLAASGEKTGTHDGALLYSSDSCRGTAGVFLRSPQPPSVQVPAPRNAKKLCPSCRGEITFHLIISANEEGRVCLIASDGVRKGERALAKAVARDLATYTFPPAERDGKAVSSRFLLNAIVEVP